MEAIEVGGHGSSLKKLFRKISQKSQKDTGCEILFSAAEPFFQSQAQFFPVNFAKFSRTTVFRKRPWINF